MFSFFAVQMVRDVSLVFIGSILMTARSLISLEKTERGILVNNLNMQHLGG